MPARASRVRGLLPIAAVVLAGLVLSLLVQERYHHRVLTLVFVWATMGLAWNIISGYAGHTSFGHQAFFGIGAYVTVLLIVGLGLTPWIGLVVGMLVAVVAAALIGFPTFRLAGIYFALATLAYPLILRIMMDFLGFQEVSIPMVRDRPGAYMQFFDPRAYDFLTLGALAAALLLSHWIETSRLGYALRALRENEQAAEAAGVDTFRAKMTAYMLSAAPAAAIGAIYSHAILFVVTPDAVFGVLVIVQTLTVCLVGGVGTKWGPLLGAAIMIPLSETLDTTIGDRLPGIQGVVFGSALILVILFAPEGLYWRLASLRGRGRTADTTAPVAPAAAAPIEPLVAEEARRSPVARGAVLLDVRGVSKAFLGLHALEDVSFDVRAGEILGIIGPNGAGKTTLFNVLNGFLAPDRGEVRHRDVRITGLAPNAVCHRGIGRTFQVVRTFPRMTVLENVMVGAFGREPGTAGAEERARRALRAVALEPRAALVPSGLTTLELRLMEIARALAAGPELILLDEPLAGLSRDGVAVLIDVVRRVREAGITVVIIEHTMYAVVQLVDRLVVLDHGRRIAEGLPGDVVRDPAVIEAYLGKRWLRRAEAAGSEKAVLKVAGLGVAYGGLQALSGVSLDVAEGEFVTIVGPNGAGKTTLMKAVSGAVAPAAGRIEYRGQDIGALPSHARARRGIAHVPEGRKVFPSLSVLENLEMGSFRPEARRHRGERLHTVFGLFPVLRERQGQLAGSLSGGEQQMLAIGRGLMAQPDLLLLDEPSQGLGPRIVEGIFEAIASVRQQRRLTILLVEQRVVEGLELCDRGYVLETGRVVLSGDRQTLLADPRVQEAYLGG